MLQTEPGPVNPLHKTEGCCDVREQDAHSYMQSLINHLDRKRDGVNRRFEALRELYNVLPKSLTPAQNKAIISIISNLYEV